MLGQTVPNMGSSNREGLITVLWIMPITAKTAVA